MTFARFEVTNFTGAGKIEVVTEEGVQTWTPGDSYAVVGEQGTLWTGTWPRLQASPSGPFLVHSADAPTVEAYEGTFQPPQLRVIRGGRA